MAIEIKNKDCFELMAEMQDKSVNLIFADPWYYPENQKTKNAFEDDVFWDITKKWMKEFIRLIKDDGHIFISFSSQKMAKFEFLLAELGVPLKSRIVWHYRNAGGRCADKGQFGKTYEMVYHLGFGDKLNFPEKWGDERFDVWTIAIPQSNFTDKKIHPFQKPIALLERIVGIGSNEGDLVLDPFSGSGTTALACKKLNRNFIGSELNKEHYENSLERLNLNGFEKTEAGGFFLILFKRNCQTKQERSSLLITGGLAKLLLNNSNYLSISPTICH